MSDFTDTPSVAPSAIAHRTMKRYYDEWTAQNLTVSEGIGRRGTSQAESNSVAGSGQEYHGFLLSSNWILRPDGLQEFFSEFSKYSLKSEITWDATLGCFRVRSTLDEGSDLMTAVRDILDRIVQPEIERVSAPERYGVFGGKSSDKIQHVTDWRTETLGEDERKAYEKFAYPRELMEMEHQDTWKMPTEHINAGVTIVHLLPTKRLLDELQKTSGCTVLVGMDGKSLRIGGMTEYAVEVAKKKMDRLSKYYVSCRAEQKCAHLNEGLLTTIFLDRTRCVLKKGQSTYGTVFSNGSVVSKALYDYASKGYRSTPHPDIAPAFEKSKAASAFTPFKGYRYSAKISTWVDADSSASHSQPSSAVVADFSSVNPQVAPNVVQWAKRTALENGKDEDFPMPTNNPLQLSQDPNVQREAKWGDVREIDPFAASSSMTASPETTNASSLQKKAPPRDLLDSPARTPKCAGPEEPSLRRSHGGDENLVSFSPEKDSTAALVSWSMQPLLPSPRIVVGEQQSREFHVTMEQRAPSKKSQNRQTQSSTAQRPDPSPEVIGKVSNRLVEILEPLRMFQGAVSLKAELGRFVFTKLNPADISLPDCGLGPPRHKTPEEIEKILGCHSNSKALLFTRIISLSGGDMNYMADLREPGDASSPVWMLSRKSVIYEFRCQTSTPDKKSRSCFIVDVDSGDFSFRIRPDIKEGSKGGVFMHCLSRTFDIQFTVDTAPYLTEDCKSFAQELVDSLTVK
ncbi:hypothetical protein PG994_010345 [Apiospora phragmitis]|uniref:Uncharacterized protein n=1 Tax=Apiospora phragmitis TaxID=2905665 RepID=A0ABR1TPM9_9PEZI